MHYYCVRLRHNGQRVSSDREIVPGCSFFADGRRPRAVGETVGAEHLSDLWELRGKPSSEARLSAVVAVERPCGFQTYGPRVVKL